MTVEKMIRGNDVAVIVSPGYGAGWSSWCREHAVFLMFDKTLVEMKEKKVSEEEVEKYLESKFGSDQHIYCGGWDKAKIEWVTIGAKLRIDEYDGYETLIELSEEEYITA